MGARTARLPRRRALLGIFSLGLPLALMPGPGAHALTTTYLGHQPILVTDPIDITRVGAIAVRSPEVLFAATDKNGKGRILRRQVGEYPADYETLVADLPTEPRLLTLDADPAGRDLYYVYGTGAGTHLAVLPQTPPPTTTQPDKISKPVLAMSDTAERPVFVCQEEDGLALYQITSITPSIQYSKLLDLGMPGNTCQLVSNAFHRGNKTGQLAVLVDNGILLVIDGKLAFRTETYHNATLLPCTSAGIYLAAGTWPASVPTLRVAGPDYTAQVNVNGKVLQAPASAAVVGDKLAVCGILGGLMKLLLATGPNAAVVTDVPEVLHGTCTPSAGLHVAGTSGNTKLWKVDAAGASASQVYDLGETVQLLPVNTVTGEDFVAGTSHIMLATESTDSQVKLWSIDPAKAEVHTALLLQPNPGIDQLYVIDDVLIFAADISPTERHLFEW